MIIQVVIFLLDYEKRQTHSTAPDELLSHLNGFLQDYCKFFIKA